MELISENVPPVAVNFLKESEKPLLFSDRDKGINFFSKIFPSMQKSLCVWHLIGNVNNQRDVKAAAKGGSLIQAGVVWSMQGSDSKEEYDTALTRLAAYNKPAADYLGKIPPKEWVSYAIGETGDVFIHGYRTNGMVESANHRFLPERQMSPLYAFESLALKVGQKIVERRDKIAELVEKSVQPGAAPLQMLVTRFDDLWNGE